jgi:hypothetical protein
MASELVVCNRQSITSMRDRRKKLKVELSREKKKHC